MKHPEFRFLIFISLACFFLWIDICLGHITGGLKNTYMWLPLIYLPLLSLTCLVTAFHNTIFRQKFFISNCYILILLGLFGFYFHSFKIYGQLDGSIQWEILIRLMRYPPALAPLGVSSLGILGLLIKHTEP